MAAQKTPKITTTRSPSAPSAPETPTAVAGSEVVEPVVAFAMPGDGA